MVGALAAKPNCVQTERLSCPPHFGGPQSDTTGILMLGQRPPMNRRRSYFFGRGGRWDLTPLCEEKVEKVCYLAFISLHGLVRFFSLNFLALALEAVHSKTKYL